MKTLIYRIRKVQDDKEGNEFIVTSSILDSEISFDEVYEISDVVHEWVSAKSCADLADGNYQKIRNNSFRALLSTINTTFAFIFLQKTLIWPNYLH